MQESVGDVLGLRIKSFQLRVKGLPVSLGHNLLKTLAAEDWWHVILDRSEQHYCRQI